MSGTFTSEGFNLVGIADGGPGFSQPTDQKGTAAAPLDPKFDPNPVVVNIGPYAFDVPGLPLCGSPAIDKATSDGLITDLRGAGSSRVIDDPNVPNTGDGADVGALERQTLRTTGIYS